MSSEQTIITDMLTQVDHYGANFASQTYHALVAQYSPVIFTLSGIYLALVFLAIKRGTQSFNQLPFILLRMTCILTLALNYDYFCLFIYNIFTQAPLAICQAIVTTPHGTGSLPMIAALDQFLLKGLHQANKLFLLGGWSNITYDIFGILLFIATILSVGIALSLILLAKIASVILLALSPIFIFFALYESTKSLFDAYINQLVCYALIPIMTCAVLMIILSVTESSLANINVGDKSGLIVLAPFLLSCLVQIWLLLQVPAKCSALASGFNLRGIMATAGTVQQGFNFAANAATGGSLGRRLMSGAANAVRNSSITKSFMQTRAQRYRDSE